jgi:outer membrane lipoprotein-sorting protein
LRWNSALAGAVLVALAASATAFAAPAPLATARALSAAMAGGRSGEAQVMYTLADPLGGPARTVRGRVRVEAPDRVRLDFPAGGERIAIRSDGGEWLQPASRQLLRIPADRALSALQWWRVLLPGSRESFREDSLGGRRYSLAPLDADAGPVRIVVRLDARGFPAELQVSGMTDETVTYRLSGWKFGPGRGAAAYRLSAPAGYETVDLP